MRNPRLGNHGLEFKQLSALGDLRDALVEEKGRSVPWDVIESLAEAAFQNMKGIWQRDNGRILPVRDYPALRLQSTTALAQFVALGGMRPKGPRLTHSRRR